ncbi:unnamed protein product [Fraxinus pennsylvanica]|uniref:Uncharacterized protein n=1 Tax=Fraxinus pennsylvanica TaxID=56036 RepID=A0AAD1ZYI2_9LAMI|nr:unnamed protein product [Fraxinus pennsylvanica]
MNWSTDASVSDWIGISFGVKHQRISASTTSRMPYLMTWPVCIDKEINLASNYFTGNVPPWFGNLTKLELLILSYNRFTGGIPRDIGNLTHLEILSRRDCSKTRESPSFIFNMSSLTIQTVPCMEASCRWTFITVSPILRSFFSNPIN